MQAIRPNGGSSEPVQQTVRKTQTLGRNDLCWCGSGKKYKHCHLKEDRAKQKV
jgi:preprotein translocase subunit SecA